MGRLVVYASCIDKGMRKMRDLVVSELTDRGVEVSGVLRLADAFTEYLEVKGWVGNRYYKKTFTVLIRDERLRTGKLVFVVDIDRPDDCCAIS